MDRQTQMVRRKRLVVLADFLAGDVLGRLNGCKFDMGLWGVTDDGSGVPRDIAKTSECGFAGCAVGWAYYCPPLVRAGVRLHIPVYHGELEPREEGVAEFFGLDVDEFLECFMPSSDGPTLGASAISSVAAKLREVAAREPRP